MSDDEARRGVSERIALLVAEAPPLPRGAVERLRGLLPPAPGEPSLDELLVEARGSAA